MSNLSCTLGVFGMVLLGSSAVLAQDAMFINDLGNVGVGTSAPTEKLHVQDGNLLVKQNTADAILKFATGATNQWNITQNATTGRLVFFFSGTGGGASTGSFKFDKQGVENLLRVGVLGPSIVDINGNLQVTGNITAANVPQPDYVFDSSYKLESIEDHSDFMWQNRHLPSLPSAGRGNVGPVNVLSHQMGMLEELEKAHIYIDQLNTSIASLREELSSKNERLDALEAKFDAITK